MAWNTLLAPLKTIVELAANLIILNVLALPQVGVLRVVTSTAATLGIWVDLGIDRSLPRFIPELEQQQGRGTVRRFMGLIFVIKLVLLLVFSAVFLLLADQFVNGLLLQGIRELPDRFDAAARATLEQEVLALTPLIIGSVLALVWLGSFYDGLMAYLVSYFRQRAWNLITIAGDLLQPVFTALLVLGGYGIGGVLVAIVVTPLVSVALAMWQVLRTLTRRVIAAAAPAAPSVAPPTAASPDPTSATPAAPPPAQPGLWRRFTTYAFFSNVMNLSDYAVSWMLGVLMLAPLGLAQVAIYSVGTALVRQVLALLYRPLVGIQVPLFTRVRGGDGDLATAYAVVGRILVLILVPGGVGLLLLAHELILVQYPQYAAATVVVWLLAPALFFETFLSTAQIVLQVYERYRDLLLSRLPTLLVVPAMWWATQQYGLVGATVAVGIGRILFGLSAAWLAHRALGTAYSWRFFGRVGLATAAMALVVWGLKWLPPLQQIGTSVGERLLATAWLLLVVLCGAATFFVVLRVLGGIEPQDRAWIAESRLPLRRWLLRVL